MNSSTTRTALFAIMGIVAFGVFTAAANGQSPVVVAGANLDIDFNQEVPVGYSGFAGAYFLQVDLVHDPMAGPMIKRFETPVTDTTDRILLDALQPFPQPIWEDFFIVPPVPGGPPVSVAVRDWHEEILTEGWEWVIPGDTRFPDLFPPDSSLITRNGEPHPWRFPPMPAVLQPNKLWVEFPPIHPGETLDVHKALLWVGAEGNRIWGDDVLDDGTAFDEGVISVLEYPTVPEPGGSALAVLGLLASGLVTWRKRSG